MGSRARARTDSSPRGVAWIVIGMVVGIGTGLTIWSQLLGNLSVGLLFGISTGLLVGIAVIDVRPPD
jgi:hypothetical protein